MSQRSYCTPACLLSLTRNTCLDQGCPNVLLHDAPGSRHHPVTHKQWVRLLQDQLNRDRDHDIEPLGLEGAVGALFKVSLGVYGYTFVAKGILEMNAHRLACEANIYQQQLRPLQEKHVPVYLGFFRMQTPYYYFCGLVEIRHMLFMSWGGQELANGQPTGALASSITPAVVDQEISRAVDALAGVGIVHLDPRDRNRLWNPATQTIVIIDFEQIEYLPVKSELGFDLKRKRELQTEEDTSVDTTTSTAPKRQMIEPAVEVS